ncbi:MAG TPA: VOC family protein [Chloroflexota bacterium]|nr:VOC family protein [Chloroflexota bacterium]
MPSAIRRLAEVVLLVRDLEASTAFYRDVLGLDVISPSTITNARFLRAGAAGPGLPSQVVLVQRPADAPALPADRRLRSVHHIGLEIAPDDVPRERARLEGLGLEVRTGTHPFLPVDAIYVDDPDGNEVELAAWAPS